MGFLDRFRKGKGEEEGVSEELEAEEEERKAEEEKAKEEQIATLKKEATIIREQLGKLTARVAELTQLIARETPMLANPVTAPSAAMEIAEATKELNETKNEIKDLEKKGKEITKQLKDLGISASGPSMFSGAGGKAAGAFKGGFGFGEKSKKIVVLVTFIISFVLILFGSIILAIIPIIFVFLMAIFWFKGRTRWLIVVPIIVFLIFFLFWSQTGTGKLLTAQAGKTMPFTYEATRAAVGPLNIMKQVMTGTYDPTQIWSSKTYEDQYAPYTDVGVKIQDVKPLRNTFLTGEDLIVVGKLSAKSLPDDNAGANIDIAIKWTEGGLGSWTACDPSRIEQAQAYFSRFQCTCPKCLSGAQSIETHTAEVAIDYAFTERAGKQIYIATYDDINRLYMQDTDPMTYYQISSAEVSSWQTTGPVGLGVGLLGGEDIIAAYDPVKNKVVNFLGISITNNGLGDITTIHSLDVTLPCDISVLTNRCSIQESDFCDVTESSISGLKLCTYSIKNDIATKLTQVWPDNVLGPGETRTVYLPFVAKEELLKGGAVTSFFTKADMRFVYREKQDVALTVRPPL